jgi:hypothetical protein
MNPAMSAATAASLNRDMVICLSCSTDRRSQASYSGPNRNGGEGPDESRDDHQVCPDLPGSEKPDGARIEAAVNREGALAFRSSPRRGQPEIQRAVGGDRQAIHLGHIAVLAGPHLDTASDAKQSIHAARVGLRRHHAA